MFADPVRKVVFTCPVCNTSIKFDVNDDEIRELFNVTEHLQCPKCNESLSMGARSMIHAIFEYNKAVQNLINSEKTTGSKIG